MQEATVSYAQAIFLMSDGEPTDDWESGLEQLKETRWFKAAVKVAVSIGDDANKETLKAFTGLIESVLEVHNAVMLKKMIKFVSIRASQVASKNSNVSDSGIDMGDKQKQQDLNANIQEFNEEAAREPDNDQVD
ncbi:MAG: hypothetical protein LBO67_01570 [Spirochaetaceae bacterium]|jgi:uncharacterized protein YegL|nr:hypothetical protein [Spirochaetaceae bacterium]